MKNALLNTVCLKYYLTFYVSYYTCWVSALTRNEDPEVDDQGNKWSLSAFLRHLKSQGIDTGALMRSIEDVIIKSLLAASYQMNTATNMFVPHPRNCFGELCHRAGVGFHKIQNTSLPFLVFELSFFMIILN